MKVYTVFYPDKSGSQVVRNIVAESEDQLKFFMLNKGITDFGSKDMLNVEFAFEKRSPIINRSKSSLDQYVLFCMTLFGLIVGFILGVLCK